MDGSDPKDCDTLSAEVMVISREDESLPSPAVLPLGVRAPSTGVTMQESGAPLIPSSGRQSPGVNRSPVNTAALPNDNPQKKLLSSLPISQDILLHTNGPTLLDGSDRCLVAEDSFTLQQTPTFNTKCSLTLGQSRSMSDTEEPPTSCPVNVLQNSPPLNQRPVNVPKRKGRKPKTKMKMAPLSTAPLIPPPGRKGLGVIQSPVNSMTVHDDSIQKKSLSAFPASQDMQQAATEPPSVDFVDKSLTDEDFLLQQTPVKVPKKRGRKSKAEMLLMKAAQELEAQTHMENRQSDSENMEVELTPSGRPRRRAAKTAMKYLQDIADEWAEPVLLTPPKTEKNLPEETGKKRRRKRKRNDSDDDMDFIVSEDVLEQEEEVEDEGLSEEESDNDLCIYKKSGSAPGEVGYKCSEEEEEWSYGDRYLVTARRLRPQYGDRYLVTARRLRPQYGDRYLVTARRLRPQYGDRYLVTARRLRPQYGDRYLVTARRLRPLYGDRYLVTARRLRPQYGDRYLVTARRLRPQYGDRYLVTARRLRPQYGDRYLVTARRLRPQYGDRYLVTARRLRPLYGDRYLVTARRLRPQYGDRYLVTARRLRPQYGDRYLVTARRLRPQYGDRYLVTARRLRPQYGDRVGSAASLSYGLAVDDGCIWDLKFCPSGGWEPPGTPRKGPEMARLGLLAVASSSGHVQIYSLPHPESLHIHREAQGKDLCHPSVCKVDCVVRLHVGSVKACSPGDNGQCFTVAWLPTKPHQYLAAGFYDGLVAIWDLKTKSILQRVRQGRVIKQYPFHSFSAHDGAVRSIEWCKADSNFFVTCGSDRRLKFWDFRNLQAPLNNIKRFQATELAWLLPYCGVVVAQDNCYASHCLCGIHYVDSGFLGYKPYFATPRKGTVWSISGSDWLSSVTSGDTTGEVMVVMLPNLNVLSINTKRPSKRRFPVYKVDFLPCVPPSVEGPDPCDQVLNGPLAEGYHWEHFKPKSYRAASSRFSLVFQDMDLTNFHNLRSREPVQRMQANELKGDLNMERVQLEAIQKVRFNPNLDSYPWIVSGGHSGLVRVHCVQGLQTSVGQKMIQQKMARFQAMYEVVETVRELELSPQVQH
ncbi:general transcription factor 3C polypeptide 2 [Phyllobates terribilis]|uniref:general transcription factor 3C polypeptide 2 n=1 Tax=Phyllobates terribilis TaxID=111132 RepID=UPI003CCB6284